MLTNDFFPAPFPNSTLWGAMQSHSITVRRTTQGRGDRRRLGTSGQRSWGAGARGGCRCLFM
eukprot:405182-Rhodomonas_salina.1